MTAHEFFRRGPWVRKGRVSTVEKRFKVALETYGEAALESARLKYEREAAARVGRELHRGASKEESESLIMHFQTWLGRLEDYLPTGEVEAPPRGSEAAKPAIVAHSHWCPGAKAGATCGTKEHEWEHVGEYDVCSLKVVANCS